MNYNDLSKEIRNLRKKLDITRAMFDEPNEDYSVINDACGQLRRRIKLLESRRQNMKL